MQVKAAELGKRLRRELAPVYLVAGDDALLVQEACDAVLQSARQAGFSERSVFHAETGFNWSDVLQDAASMSLFATRRIVDVRVASGKIDREGSELLRRYTDRPPQDTLLLIRMPRLESKQNTSAWFKAVDKAGVAVLVWPLELRELPRWLDRRLRDAGLTLEKEALMLLAERVEGNLLAAVQEIEKLKLAGLGDTVSAAVLQEILEDAAHYDSFDLIDGALSGDAPRISRMVQSLRQEGVSVFAVLGALTSQLRRIAEGGYVPGPRRRLVEGFAQRIGGIAAVDAVLAECALVDAQGKGQIPGDPWASLESLLLRLCGVAVSPMRLSPAGPSWPSGAGS